MNFISANGISSIQSRSARSAMRASREQPNSNITSNTQTYSSSATAAFVLSSDLNLSRKTSPLLSKSKSTNMLQRNPTNPEMIEFSMYNSESS